MTKNLWCSMGALILVAGSPNVQSQGTYESQPVLGSRVVQLLRHEGLQFRDLNKNRKVDVYEDWRQPVSNRVADLVSRMTVEEKAGMLMINTLNAQAHGTLSDQAVQYVEEEKMTRFIFRNTVTATPDAGGAAWRGAQITPYEAAQFMNAMQELTASTRLGIPALFKSNARNGPPSGCGRCTVMWRTSPPNRAGFATTKPSRKMPTSLLRSSPSSSEICREKG